MSKLGLAQLSYGGIFPAGAVEGEGLLEGVLASTEFDILATASETTTNLTVTPSSGANASEYDIILGVDGGGSTDEPGFTTNYWTFDGGDFLTQVAGLTAFQKNLHKTTGGQAATIGIIFRTGTITSANTLWDTAGATNEGVRLSIAADGRLLLRQIGGGAGNNWTIHAGLSDNTIYCIFVAFDFTTSTTNVEHWINTATGTTNTDGTADASTANPPDDLWRIGARADTTPDLFLTNGSRVYAFNGFTGILSDADIATAHTNLESRITGLDCTP